MATTDQLNLRNAAIATLLLMIGVGMGATGALDNIPMLNSADTPDQDDPEETLNNVEMGVGASFEVATFDRTADSSTQVGTDAYSWKTTDDQFYLGSTASDASSRATFGEFVTGDTYKVIGFGDTYDYGVSQTGTISAETELANLDVYEGAAPSDIETTLYDKNGDSTTSVSLGSDEEYSFSGLEVRVGSSNVAYNPKVVAFSLPDGTNVSSLDMGDAKEISIPQRLKDSSTDYDYAFEVYNANEGTPSMMEWESQESGNIVVKADADGTNGETVEYAILDYAPFINGDDGLSWGVEDDSTNPSDVGVSDVSGTFTLN